MSIMSATRANEQFDAAREGGAITFRAVCGCGRSVTAQASGTHWHWASDEQVRAQFFPGWVITKRGSGVKNQCPECVA
jgi:hypothetical protein